MKGDTGLVPGRCMQDTMKYPSLYEHQQWRRDGDTAHWSTCWPLVPLLPGNRLFDKELSIRTGAGILDAHSQEVVVNTRQMREMSKREHDGTVSVLSRYAPVN